MAADSMVKENYERNNQETRPYLPEWYPCQFIDQLQANNKRRLEWIIRRFEVDRKYRIDERMLTDRIFCNDFSAGRKIAWGGREIKTPPGAYQDDKTDDGQERDLVDPYPE